MWYESYHGIAMAKKKTSCCNIYQSEVSAPKRDVFIC